MNNLIKKTKKFFHRKGIDPIDLLYIGISFSFLLFVIGMGIASLFV